MFKPYPDHNLCFLEDFVRDLRCFPIFAGFENQIAHTIGQVYTHGTFPTASLIGGS